MHTQSSLTQHQREQLIQLFQQGTGSNAAAKQLNISPYAARALERRYKLHGTLCLMEKTTKQHYPFEIKKEVVTRNLNGESRMHLAQEFGLSSDNLVKSWVRAWRTGGDEALIPKPKGRPKGSATPKTLTEEDKLRREVQKLRAENAYLKKLRDLRNQQRD